MKDSITFSDEDMVAWANASIERNAELEAEIERLHAAIKLIDAQLGDGEGVGVLHYFERAYPGDAIDGHADLVELVIGILSENTKNSGGAMTNPPEGASDVSGHRQPKLCCVCGNSLTGKKNE